MKKRWIVTTGILVLLAMAACKQPAGNTEPTPTPEPTATPTPFVAEVVGIYEAEDALLTGNVTAATHRKCSGGGHITGFKEDADTCTFTVQIENDGFYDIAFVIATTSSGTKTNYACVDGSRVGEIVASSKDYAEDMIERVWLSKGEHTVSIEVSWGWISVDCIRIQTAEPLPADFYEVEAKLSNPNASDVTKRLMSYLCDIYGEKFLSGQVCNEGRGGLEIMVVKKTTGKIPAIIGMDMGDYTLTNVKHGSVGSQMESAIRHWNEGGITELHWHWNTPDEYVTGTWYRSFYTSDTKLNIEKIMNGEDPAGYDALMADIDAIAEQLKKLKEAGVPVLWRPLHEASGGWFWWGAKGPEAYKKLYIKLYEKLTYEHGLDNLIWVWNGQAADWYPGDEYVDIVGQDIYPGERAYSSQINKFLEVASYSDERKMVYLTECGCIFDPDLAKRDGAMWGMWAVWSGEYVRKTGNFAALSEQYTEKEMMIKAYEHELVITADELPDFSTYPIRDSLK